MNPSRRRWLMIALAFWATVINYLDRQTLSVAAPVLREQFHMSNVAYSRVVFAFLLAYTIMNGASGPLIDRLGTRLGYALTMLWWSAASILHIFARGALSLGAFRFLLGMGEAGNWPAAVKVVAEWFPEKERALAAGIFNSGSAVGAILAPPVVATILLHWGWQPAFAATGVAGFLWLLFWWPIYRPQPVSAARHQSPPISAGVLIRTRFVWSFTVAKIFLDPVWYFYIFWFPEYLKHARHFDLAAIGTYSWIPFAVAGAGNLLGGGLSGFLLRRGATVTVARKSAITFFAALMLSAIPAVLAPTAAGSIAFVSIAMLGYTGALANMLSLPADVFPGNAVASVYGLASMGSGFGGMVFTLITGWVVDHYSYTPVFIGFGILPLICATLLWTLTGPLMPLTRSRDS
ncbi:Major facilitator superfamily MFS_1 [Candidatus Sulfopaludibacter sp. SbA3]|nr:Major facilitator superfamily MFS_1 [Candidatus Sulfopaludibacter sp. SbA3]